MLKFFIFSWIDNFLENDQLDHFFVFEIWQD